MPPADRLRLEHMLAAARDAVHSLHGKTRPDLELRNDFTLALVKRIEMIGEAASRVGPATRQRFPEIPWQDIVDTRHRLIHGYAEINLTVVWTIATGDLPHLISSLERALQALP